MNSVIRLLAVPLLLVISGCAGNGFAVAGPSAPPPSHRDAVMDLVVQQAPQFGIAPSLALAVAHTESNFNPRAESSAGARGVMQIMPRTARDEYGVEADLLWNARLNVRLGLHFLRRLIDRYGRVDIALSHYNGGSAVGRPGRARVIPATRRYVAKVRRLDLRYQQIIRRRQTASFIRTQHFSTD